MTRITLLAITAVVALLPTLAAAQTVDSLAPDRLVRGRVTEVIVRGDGLDQLDAVEVSGDGLAVGSWDVGDAATASFTVGVGDRAATGTRSVTFTGDGVTPIVRELEIVPGTVELISLSPTTASRGDRFDLTFVGLNLDAVTELDLGTGITVHDITVESPIRLVADVEVLDGAFAGVRDIVAITDGADATFTSAFTVLGSTPVLTRIVPTNGTRGSTVSITISGTDLDAVDAIQFGSRVTVSDFTVSSPTLATATVEIRDEATAGGRVVSALFGDDVATFSGLFAVRRGDLEVTRVRPDRLVQGTETTVTLDGLNLDGVTSIDAGEGIDVDLIDVGFPTTLTAVFTTSTDAAIGLREITLTGSTGVLTVDDAVTVAPFILPEPAIFIGDNVDVGDTQIGAWNAGGFLLENIGDVPETVVVGPADGDDDVFWLVEPGTRRSVTELTFELDAGQQVVVESRFAPDVRGQRGVAWPIAVRDGQETGRVNVLGDGVDPTLFFNQVVPAEFDPIEADVATPLPRIDTELGSGVLPRSVEILGVRTSLERDGVPVDTPAEFISLESASTISGDTLFWGSTEVTATLNAPAGQWRGSVIFTTDEPSARQIPFTFSVTVGEGGGGDTGPQPDAGMDAGMDAGADAGTDTGPSPDAGDDAGPQPDTGSPDAGADTGGDDTGAPPDTSGTDAGTEDSGSDDDTSGGGGGDGGGCAAAPAGRAPLAAFALVALAFLRRRR